VKSTSNSGLAIAALITESGYTLTKGEKSSSPDLPQPNVWVRITPDDTVTVYIGKSEMGQGAYTSLPMILADELDVDWKQIRVETSPAGQEYKDPEWGMQTTGGSTSVKHMFEPLRKAGAAAREMIVKAAAARWDIRPDECEAVKGRVRNKKNGESLSYGTLCLDAAELPVPKRPRLKKKERFTIIGTSPARLDITDKVNGTALFGTDIFVPGMIYAAIERPPAFGARVISYDENSAGEIPGVCHVIRLNSGVAVCADTIETAWRGRSALAIKWDKGIHPDLSNETLKKDFASHLEKKGATARSEGDIVNALAQISSKIEAMYSLPYLAHAAIEPMNCTAYVVDGRCDIWVPTQDQSDIVRTASKLTGLDPDRIYVHTTYLGGGFGRRLEIDYAVEAVELSKATGRPVKLLWTRGEDLKNDFYRPACLCKMVGAIDKKGCLMAWSQKVVVPSIFSRVYPQAIENSIDPAAVEGLADMEYEVPHILTEYVNINTPVPVGFWRSVGHSHNAFVVECFVDEVAAKAGKDPLDFRLGLLKSHARSRRVLEIAAEKAGWGKPRPSGRGCGIAQHFSYGSHVAQIAEVSVDEKFGKIRVHRVVCAVDCGSVINPDILASQIEGGIIFGLSAALKEEVLFEHGGVKSGNFDAYQMLRMSETPEIEVYTVERGEELGGIGEVAVPPIAPAVANAVFDSTGTRLRNLPMRPGAVREAMKH
jgi:isoquinoline 1-oxidoreductase beta subunit